MSLMSWASFLKVTVLNLNIASSASSFQAISGLARQHGDKDLRFSGEGSLVQSDAQLRHVVDGGLITDKGDSRDLVHHSKDTRVGNRLAVCWASSRKKAFTNPGITAYENARYKCAKSSFGASVTKLENASATEAFCDMS